MKVEPVILEGEFVRLEPLRVDHLPALCRVGLDESLWQLTANLVTDKSDLERYVRSALADQMLGTAIPFVTIERAAAPSWARRVLETSTRQIEKPRSVGPGSIHNGSEP